MGALGPAARPARRDRRRVPAVADGGSARRHDAQDLADRWPRGGGLPPRAAARPRRGRVVRDYGTTDDTRRLAIAWVDANIPEGSTLLIDPFTTSVETDRYEVLVANEGELVPWSDVSPKLRPEGVFPNIGAAWTRSPDALLDAIATHGVDYIMLSTLWIDQFRAEADSYPREVAVYETLLDAFPVVETFDRADAPIGTGRRRARHLDRVRSSRLAIDARRVRTSAHPDPGDAMRMDVRRTSLPEVLIVEHEVFEDERGFFMEVYRADQFAEFADLGLPSPFVQLNHSRSVQGVTRGPALPVGPADGQAHARRRAARHSSWPWTSAGLAHARPARKHHRQRPQPAATLGTGLLRARASARSRTSPSRVPDDGDLQPGRRVGHPLGRSADRHRLAGHGAHPLAQGRRGAVAR